jgi:hypothetical protein
MPAAQTNEAFSRVVIDAQLKDAKGRSHRSAGRGPGRPVALMVRIILFAVIALAAAGCADTDFTWPSWQDLRLERGASCRRPCAESMEPWRQ